MLYTHIKGIAGKSTYTKGVDVDEETYEGDSFEDFIDGYPSKFEVLSNKENGDLFIGAEFNGRGEQNHQNRIIKNAKNIIGIHFLVLDYDNGTSIEEAENNLQKYSYLLHSSYNHKQPKEGIVCDRFRVIIPLKTEVSVSDFNLRKSVLINLFPTADKASFSCAQAFLTPSKKSDCSPTHFKSNIGKKFDLLSLQATDSSDSLDSLPTAPSLHLADYRKSNYRRRANEIISGERYEGLQLFAGWLRYYHAEYNEMKCVLDEIVASFPNVSKLKHQDKTEGIATWIVKSNNRFAQPPILLPSPCFVSIEEAQEKIKEALNGDKDTSIIVTAGVGKTRLSIDFAIEQALKGKEVAFYAASNSFQGELQKEIQKRRANDFSKASANSFRKPTHMSAPEIMSARNQDNCDFYDSTIVKLKQRELSGETGLVGSHCKKDCLYSVNNGEGCRYAEQFKILNRVRIYTHAQLFAKRSVFDKHYKPDIVIIDEDPFYSSLKLEKFDVDSANKTRDFYRRASFKEQKFEGAVGTLLKELSYTNITSPDGLLSWCNKESELIDKAYKEQIELKKLHKENSSRVPHFFERQIVNALREILNTKTGVNNIYVKDNDVYYTYLKKPLIPTSARVISLDATGDIGIISKVLQRNLEAVKIDVNKSDSSTIIQVSNVGASQSRLDKKDGYAKSRREYLDKRSKKRAKIITKKSEAKGPLYYGKCRGSNRFNDCKELHIAMNYSLPPHAIENATRAVFWDTPEPFEYDEKNLASKNTKFNISDNIISNFTYVDQRARTMDSYLACAEIEQAVHRARPVRRTSENPVNIIIHTNRVLNITIDKYVRWQDLYSFVDGDMQRSIDTFNQFKKIVFDGAKNGLVWKSRNVRALGVNQSQWASYKDILKLEEKRFYALEITYRNQARKKKTERAIFVCELYKGIYREPVLNFGALEALLDAKAIISTKKIFGTASLNLESS